MPRHAEELCLAVEDGDEACPRLVLAASPWSRMRGLLGRAGLERGEGLLIRPSSSVHTFAMRFPIDVVFLDRELAVLKIVPALAPWRLASCRGAKAVLELSAGESAARGLAVGQRLRLESR